MTRPFLKRIAPLAIALSLFGLSGCMGLGVLAVATIKKALPDKTAERVAAAQAKAIMTARGGSPGSPIEWSDEKSAIRGTLLPKPDESGPEGCRRFEETVIMSGHALRGEVTACLQKDGSWRLVEDEIGGGK